LVGSAVVAFLSVLWLVWVKTDPGIAVMFQVAPPSTELPATTALKLLVLLNESAEA
jgi:hypothetical protein